MKKTILTLFMLAASFPAAQAGQITSGAVPGAINYQGRLERDNAPLTGIVHITFRIYDALTAGTLLWASDELTITANQGIFNATISLPWTVLTGTAQRYLEVQVEGDILTPREAISSVAYALVAKKLEDGGDVDISTLTITGGMTISEEGIRFPDNSLMTSASVGMSTGGVTSPGDVRIQAGGGGSGNVYFTFGPGASPPVKLTILNGGNTGIGTQGPMGKLDVDGSLFVGSEGIYGRDGVGDINLKGRVYVSSGLFLGADSEYLSVGATPNVIALVSGGAERMRVHTNGYVGIGLTNPTASLQASGIIYSAAGVRGSSITIGSYDPSSLGNEIRTQTNVPLLLQQNSAYNVGIGTATPEEKLHVLGSVRASKGVIASTAAFSGNVTVGGDFTANGNYKHIYLSSTTIYGSLQVTGDFLSQNGSTPAYKNENNIFTGQNTFQSWLRISSDTITTGRAGAGLVGLDFSEAKYLQVGDYDVAGTDGLLYIAGGQTANAKLKFYIGGTGQAASFETQGGANLALVVGGQTKTLTDATYHRIQNSVVWISTGYNSTPGVFVSSAQANVGMGTSVLDPNARLTVLGNIRISTTAIGQDYGIIFPNGSIMRSSSSASVDTISNNADAIVKADADTNGTGDVLLKVGDFTGLTLKPGGNVGIGTVLPVSLLNVQGGDLVLGTPVQGSYATNGVDDLLMEGTLVVDGTIKQRSTTPVEFYSILSAGNVYLSTAGAMTRIGSDTVPSYTLDITGNMRASTNINVLGNIQTGGVTRVSSGGDWNGNTVGVGYGGTGMTSYTTGDIVYASAAGTLNKLADAAVGNALISKGAGVAPAYDKIGLTTHITGTLAVGNGGTNSSAALSGNSIMISDGSGIVQGAKGTTTTLLHGNASGSPSYSAVSLVNDITGTLAVGNGGTGLTAGTQGGMPYFSATNAMTSMGAGTSGQALRSGGTGAPTWGTLAVGGGGTGATSLTGVIKGNGTSAFGAMTGTQYTLAKWSDANTIAAGALYDYGTALHTAASFTTLSSGTFRASGAAVFSIETSSGIYIKDGTLRMPSGAVDNYVLVTDGSGNANWKSVGAGGVGDDWGDQVVITNANGTLTGSGINSDKLGIDLTNANTWSGVQTFSNGLTCTGCISLTAEVSGILPGANGGTNNGFMAFSGPASTLKTFTLPNASATILTTNAAVTAAQGGTGLGAVAINNIIYTSAANTFSAAPISFFGRSLIDDAAASNARTTLGLAIDSDVQAYDAGLLSIAGLTTVADRMIYTTASDTYAVATLTAAGRAILDDANNTAQRTTLGLEIGVDVQAYNTGLATIAGLAQTDGNFIVGSGANWVVESGATVRTSLGLGALAVQNAVDVGSQVTGVLGSVYGGTGSSGLNPTEIVITDGVGDMITMAFGIDAAAFSVVSSTDPEVCFNLTFSKGLLTAKGAVACP